jgi:UPF0716 protein FxsA
LCDPPSLLTYDSPDDEVERGSYLVLIRIFLLLITLPLLETLLLLLLADMWGFPATFAMVILTGLLGAWLLRRQGVRAGARIRGELARGVPPAAEFLDGLLIVMAGVLLMTPGILTDSLGIALLVPASRAWLRRRLSHWFRVHWQARSYVSPAGDREPELHHSHSDVIDSYVVRSADGKRK